MQLPKPFRKQDKQKSISYSLVDDDADSLKPATGARAQVITPPGWPASAGLIVKAEIWIAIDCLLLVLPITFMTLAIIAVKLDGGNLSPYGKHVQDAILLGPTVYPLVFAALGGRAMRKIALWRAGEGTTLGFLEHLLGSQSLAATLEHAATMHTVDVLTLALLAFWSLSPFGGQSVLRLLHETNITIAETRPVFYPNVDAQSQFVMAMRLSDIYNQANAVVNSALMTIETREWTPVDAWNHPKIPRIDGLEIAASKNTADRSWYTLDPSGNYSYASLVGVNIMNLSERGSTNLTVPYEYMYFDCAMSSPETKFYVFTEVDRPQNQSKLITEHWGKPQNTSSDPFANNSFCMYSKYTKNKLETLLYGSRYTGSNKFFLWECSMNSVMVEANIMCQSDKCGVDRIRRKDKKFEEYTYLGRTPYGMTHSWQVNLAFIKALALLGGKASDFSPNPVDAYIYGHSPWAKIPEGEIMIPQNWTEYEYGLRELKDMSRRLTKVLNTYLDSSRWDTAITQSDPFARKSLNATGQPIDAVTMRSTEAVVSLLVTVYKVNAPWAMLLVICPATLLLLSIFGIFVQLRTVAPDIFNHVSSLTHDNRHVIAPAGGSGLDGADRARLLKEMHVQVGDVEPHSEAGYVAFRSVSNIEDCQEGRIQRDRIYR